MDVLSKTRLLAACDEERNLLCRILWSYNNFCFHTPVLFACWIHMAIDLCYQWSRPKAHLFGKRVSYTLLTIFDIQCHRHLNFWLNGDRGGGHESRNWKKNYKLGGSMSIIFTDSNISNSINMPKKLKLPKVTQFSCLCKIGLFCECYFWGIWPPILIANLNGLFCSLLHGRVFLTGHNWYQKLYLFIHICSLTNVFKTTYKQVHHCGLCGHETNSHGISGELHSAASDDTNGFVQKRECHVQRHHGSECNAEQCAPSNRKASNFSI